MFLDTKIRIGITDDLPFIIKSWTQAMYDIYPNRYVLDFNSKYKGYVQKLCQNSMILICYDAEDEHEIISYLIYTSFQDQLVVHYAYTKLDARKEGKLTDLLSFANVIRAPIIFTHPAKNEKIMKHFSHKYIYDPYLINLLEIK